MRVDSLDDQPAATKVEVISSLTTTTSFAVVDRGFIRFFLIDEIIVGARFRFVPPSDRAPTTELDDFSDELAFAAWTLQVSALFATCTDYYPAYKAIEGPTREAVIVPCRQSRQALCLGGGAGSVAMYLDRRNVTVDMVELHPEMVDLAERHGGLHLQNGGRIIIGDALEILAKGRERRKKYDIIIHDLFDGTNSVELLAPKNMELLLRDWLDPQGMLVFNLLGSAVQGHAAHAMTDFTFQSLRSKFNHVRCYRDAPLDMHPHRVGNVACYATNNERGVVFTLPDTIARAPQDEFPTSWNIREFQKWIMFQADEGYEGDDGEGDASGEEKHETNECVVVEYEGACIHWAPKRVSAPRWTTLHPPSDVIQEEGRKQIKLSMEAHAKELLGADLGKILRTQNYDGTAL